MSGRPPLILAGGAGTRGYTAQRPRIEPNMIGGKITEVISNNTLLLVDKNVAERLHLANDGSRYRHSLINSWSSGNSAED